MKASSTQYMAAALLASALMGCAPAIHFRSHDKAGGDESAPPTEMITEQLIVAERQQHREVAHQGLDELLVPNPPPYVIGSGENQEDGRSLMRAFGIARALHSPPFRSVYVGRDGVTHVWKVDAPSPSIAKGQ